MSAEVISYSADEWDTRLSLKLQCLDCQMEWGWSADTKGTYRWLQNMADMHNGEHHTPPAGVERADDGRGGDAGD